MAVLHRVCQALHTDNNAAVASFEDRKLYGKDHADVVLLHFWNWQRLQQMSFSLCGKVHLHVRRARRDKCQVHALTSAIIPSNLKSLIQHVFLVHDVSIFCAKESKSIDCIDAAVKDALSRRVVIPNDDALKIV